MATTPNYSFSVYSSTDTDVRFLDFRVATAGSQSTSNFYVIDTVLKQHSDAIDSINATPSAFVVKGTYSSGSLYTASVANYPGYKNEQLIVLSLNQKNTGAVQININGTTNKDVMKYGSDGVLKAVDAGDFVANSPVLCLYDGTRFVVIGITSASSITVTGEAGDILQIADDGTIESSGKKAAQPNGIATLDENGNVVQVANMANSAAAVYSGTSASIAYAGENRIASITAYGENAQGGTTEAPVALTGVDSVFVGGRNLLPKATKTQTIYGVTFTPNPNGSVSVSGTATTNVGYSYVRFERALLGRTVCLSGGSTQAQVLINERLSSGAFVRNVLVDRGQGISGTLTKQKEDNILYVTIQVLAGTTVNTTIYPMLNLGESPLPYEPYQGRVTPLPIPRPLHKVGDVRDVCRTRVKSVYDKRIVLDGTENWTGPIPQPAGGYLYKFRVPGLADTVANTPSINSHFKTSTLADGNLPTNSSKISLGSIYLCVPQSSQEDFKSYLAAQKEAGTPLTVYYRSTAYDGTNGLDVCLTEYQTGFVELDGTENWQWNTASGTNYFLFDRGLPNGRFVDNEPTVICDRYKSASYSNRTSPCVYAYDYGGTSLGFADNSYDSVDNWKSYLAAQKAAGTPVQIAYQLATPETYATDPVDFDNTAGPLTVVTGGQVEVKMTDFVTDRTPAFLNKLDKTGDGSDVTVTFTEAATDTDIASGDKLSILFGKILKRFSTITSKFTTVDNSITQIESDISDITDGTTVVAQANKVTNALVIMSNSGTALVNYDGSATANMTLSPSNVGAEPAFTKNTAFNKNFGSSAGTVCQGNDSRLSNARRSSNISMSLSGTNLSISYS